MKYFTKEELEDITSNLLKEPTRETLKSLNEKYNGHVEMELPLTKEEVSTNVEPPVVNPIPNITEYATPIESVTPVTENKSVAMTIPNFDIPNIEVPKKQNLIVDNANVQNFEIPKLETPVFNNQNNEPVLFSGDLWNTGKTEPSNLMQTTDNFNVTSQQTTQNAIPVTGAPFFSGNSAPSMNNQVPVQGPTMFGQMQQNYM